MERRLKSLGFIEALVNLSAGSNDEQSSGQNNIV